MSENHERTWRAYKEFTDDEVAHHAAILGVSHFYTRLLLIRGITTVEQATNFFSPNPNLLFDPFLMMDMDKAVDRISLAKDNNQIIWVYGDYDVDGTTSVALVFSFLRQFFDNIEYYVPDREKEGYGISKLSVDLAAEKGVKLIIALDCGIRSVELIDYAANLGVHYIICDHHEPGDKLPNAIAVLDPKRTDCSYPFQELSGCGIGFKLVQALCVAWDLPEEDAFEYLDFVAVSVASDLVPMVDENRILTSLGLIKLNENPSPGLKMIIEKFIDKPDLDVTNVVFMIGPRINAAGRMAHAKSAVQLLLAEDEDEADKLSVKLNEYNLTRRGLDKSITAEALEQIEDDASHKDRKTTVVYAPNWHKGVVGIVASRLMEVHYRPTIVLTQTGNALVGSARSIEAFNVHDALVACSEVLIQFGGHKYAAGLKLEPANLDRFKVLFEASADELTSEELTLVLKYEAEIPLSAIHEQLVTNLKRFAPHGPENPQPLFLTKNVWDTGQAKTMGGDHSHLRLNVVDESNNQALGAVCFGMGDLFRNLNKRQKFDMLYTIEENHFNGRTSIQLMVKDIRLA